MGACLSSTEDKANAKRNEEIENQLKNDKLKASREIKMLLLGAGESGKSTILKQMKLIHDGGYNKEEKEAFKEIIFSNIIQSMRVILEAMKMLGVGLGNAGANEAYSKTILELPGQIEGDSFPADLATAIKNLWADSGVQECFKRSNEYQLNDSAK